MKRNKEEHMYYEPDMAKNGTGKERSIDLSLTGRLLRLRIRRAGFSVRQLQDALGLDCPQSIYRWFSGQSLPSVENLYLIHRLLGCRIEDLLVTKDRPLMRRCAAYYISREKIVVSA